MNKIFKILGMVVSIGLVIFGILIMTGTFRDSVSYPDYALSSYDHGYAIFGADFYNYVCNNSAEAADAAQAAAYNTVDIIEILTGGFGAVIMAMGLLGFCFFGVVPGGVIKVQNIACATPAPAPVVTPATAVAPAPVTAPVVTETAVEEKEEPAAVEVQEPEAEIQLPDIE